MEYSEKLREINILGAFGILIHDRIFQVISQHPELSGQEGIALIQIGLFSPTFNNLQVTLQLTQSATSRLVNKLVEKQLIAKSSHSDDLREKTLGLTAKGEQLVQKIIAKRYTVLNNMLKALDVDEQLTLFQLISKILEHSISNKTESDRTCRFCDLCNCPQDICPAQPNK